MTRQQPQHIFRLVAAVIVPLLSGACGASGELSGGAEVFIGGAEGDLCDAALQNEGCYNKAGDQLRMGCSPTTGTWTLVAQCEQFEVCHQIPDPEAEPGTYGKLTECQKLSAAQPDVSADGSALDGGGDSGGGDSGSGDAKGSDSGPAADVGPITTDAGTPPTDTGPILPIANEVDPFCIDGKYKEALPNPNASIQDEIGGYAAAEFMKFIYGVLNKRYPWGQELIQGAIKKAPQNCIDLFLPANMRGSAQSVMSRMGVLVHECGHMYDIYPQAFGSSSYAIFFDVSFKCDGLRSNSADTGSGGSNSSFPRSLIKQDAFGGKRPPCEDGTGSHGCDTYAKIYLNGDPTNGKFESGDQGYDLLFEEIVQYVNSLANGYAFQDQKGGMTSDRDGILTFLWYLERYLHMARTKYPKVHQTILSNSCWRTAALTVWGRAWMYLKTTEKLGNLGIDHDKIIQLVRDPTLLAEIQYLRDAEPACK